MFGSYKGKYSAETKGLSGGKGKIIAIAAGAVAAVAVVTIAGFGIYYAGHWYSNSKVCGVDVSGMTYQESVSTIKDTMKNYKLEIKARDKGEITLDADQLGIKAVPDFEDQLEKIYQKQHDKFFLFRIGSSFSDEFVIASCSKEKVEEAVNESKLVKGDSDYTIVKPVNAKIVYSEQKGYAEVQPELKGNTIRKKELVASVVEAADKFEKEINIADEKKYPDVYKKAKLTKDNKAMNDLLNEYNGYILHWLQWKMEDGTTAVLGPKDLQKCVSLDQENQKVVLDKDKVADWVEAFCLKYKTSGGVRKFKTHDGRNINVAGGDYGWKIDYYPTVEQVQKCLEKPSKKSAVDAYIKDSSDENKKALTKTLEKIYYSKGYIMDATHKMEDYDTQNYSEVDLTQQMVFVYKKGKLVYSCKAVTGLSTDPTRATRTGVYDVKEKKLSKILRGANYVTPTKYWVRIMWTGTGYHFMNRRDWGSWSPALHTYRGSHGCINLQYNDAQNIYNLVNIGDPVFIHN